MMVEEFKIEYFEWQQWFRHCALPLWGGAGFDLEKGRFEERLGFNHRPIETSPQRLMVQGRQIFVFANASLSGLYPEGRDLAIKAYNTMVKSYLEADGSPGWVFSIHRDGGVASSVRDTYAHAFAMFGLAHYFRLTGDSTALTLADEIWDYLDKNMVLAAGGYADALPRSDSLRRQNPHMHLLEAALWLFEISGNRKYLDRAAVIETLFRSRFFDRETGSVTEYLDDSLNPAPGDLGQIREPGHHYEWAWLLQWFSRARCRSADGSIGAILKHADRFGWSCPEDLIFDEVYAKGTPCSSSFRLWPLTEAIKACVVCYDFSQSERERRLARLIWVLRNKFLEPLGGWTDRYLADGRRAVEFMPASSLYHLYCAYMQTEQLINNQRWPLQTMK